MTRYKELKDIVLQARELIKQQDKALKNNGDTIETEAIEFIREIAEKKLRRAK